MRLIFALLLSAWLGSSATAAELAVTLKTPAGQPIRDAVVSYQPASGGAPVKSGGRFEMVQEDIQFHPFVLVVPLGAEVFFPNHDKVRHHVYSFSAAKHFELKLYGREEARSIRFDKAGIVALGCNIHDSMIGFIDVVDTPYAVKTDDKGRAILQGVPNGSGVLTVWHPYLRAPKNEQTYALTPSSQGATNQTYTLDIRSPPPSMSMSAH